MSPNSFVDKVSQNFKELLRKIDSTNTDFIRTTEKDIKLLVINFGTFSVKKPSILE